MQPQPAMGGGKWYQRINVKDPEKAIKVKNKIQVYGSDADTSVMLCRKPANLGFTWVLWILVLEALVLNIMGIVSITQSHVNFTADGVRTNFFWMADNLTGMNTTKMTGGDLRYLFKASANARAANAAFAFSAAGTMGVQEALYASYDDLWSNKAAF